MSFPMSGGCPGSGTPYPNRYPPAKFATCPRCGKTDLFVRPNGSVAPHKVKEAEPLVVDPEDAS